MILDCVPVAIVAWLLVALAEALRIEINSPGWFFLLLGWPYCVLLESSRWRATPGKLALGLEVVDVAGGRIGFGRATGRYFAKFLSFAVFLVGFLLTDFTPRRQALHDYISATYVVRRKPLGLWLSAGSPQSGPQAVTARSIGSILGNIMLLSIVAVFGWLVYRMISNSNELRNFCTSLKPGMTREQLQQAVQAKQLGEKYYHDDHQVDFAIVVIPGAFPPNQCYVEFDGDQVKSSKYVPFN